MTEHAALTPDSNRLPLPGVPVISGFHPDPTVCRVGDWIKGPATPG